MEHSTSARYSFLDDYSEGCHPAILDALAAANSQQQASYGDDSHSQNAKALIRQALGDSTVPVHFVTTGTVANTIAIAASLRPHEAVIAATTGHIAVHEAGAIEATGHKIIAIPGLEGKLTPRLIETAVAANTHAPHMAKPRLVYLSNATEVGTVYTKAELRAIADTCKAMQLLLMVDGARLGTALCSSVNDMTMQDVVELSDIFWIGGTKAGALLGEAIVIPEPQLANHFAFHIKQRGALLAKGRLLGVQFETLFTDDLFFTLARHANQAANQLSQGITNAGYTLAAQTQSNQVFPILPDTVIEALRKHFNFYTWSAHDEHHSVVRLVTSWATDLSQVEAFTDRLRSLGS